MPDLSRMTERQSVPCALLSDINLNLVRERIDTAIKRRGYDGLAEPIDRAVELLWARSEHRTHILSTERVEEHAYPLVVLRELTVNAVVHRERS